MNGSQSSLNTATTAAAGRPSHVSEQSTRFANNLDDLGNVVCNLEARLNPVLRDEPPAKAEGVSPAPPPAPYLVLLADDLRGKNNAMAALTERLNSIFNRLEL